MSDAIVIVDNKGCVVFINKQTEKLFDYSREEVIGQPVEIFIPIAVRDAHQKYRNTYTGCPEARPMELQKSLIGITRQGNEISVEIGLSPLTTENGILTLATVRNVTRRREIEKQLRHSKEILEKRVIERTADLQAANEKLQTEMSERRIMEERARQQQAEITHVSRLSLLGEMSSGLAHELNQPLAAISNYSQGCIRRIQSGTGEKASFVQALERITSEANRASEIIARLRKFVRKEELQKTCIDLNTIVLEVLDLVDFELRDHSIQTNSALADNLPEVCIDTIQIQQVLVNLVWNAIEAMEENTKIDRILSICTRLLDVDTVEITISDNGYGINKETADKLFNPFFTTKEHGVGIGLSISRTIIDDHGGKIWAESNVDRGTVFKFNLPIAKN